MFDQFLNLFSRQPAPRRQPARVQQQPPASARRTPIRVGPSQPIRVGPAQTIVVGPAQAVRIQPPQRGAWDDKGWQRGERNGHQFYTGQFRVRQRSSGRELTFPGMIEIVGREPVPFIANLPASIRSHPKGPCFMQAEQGWHRLHWHRPPHTADEAILYVERILSEVLN